MFLDHVDHATHRYSVAALPALDTKWVCIEPSRKNNQTLCVENDAPLVLWITGEVKRALFIYADGGARIRVGIQVNPIHEGDTAKLTKLLRDLTSIGKSLPNIQ